MCDCLVPVGIGAKTQDCSQQQRSEYLTHLLTHSHTHSLPPSLDVMVWTTDHVVAWAESVGLEEFAQSLHGSGVHGGVIALDNSFDAEALAMAMQHLHDVSDELPSLCLTHSLDLSSTSGSENSKARIQCFVS